jgi:large subunit ribosomal protein L16
MWTPRKTKYPKIHKSRMNTILGARSISLQKGNLGIIAMQAGILFPYQLEALKRTLKRMMKKKGKLWFRIFPNHQKTKKSLGVRMGKGKGSVYEYYCMIRPLQLICEFRIGRKTKPIKLAELAYKCKDKIHLPTALVYKKDIKVRRKQSIQKTAIFKTKYLIKIKLMDVLS